MDRDLPVGRVLDPALGFGFHARAVAVTDQQDVLVAGESWGVSGKGHPDRGADGGAGGDRLVGIGPNLGRRGLRAELVQPRREMVVVGSERAHDPRAGSEYDQGKPVTAALLD